MDYKYFLGCISEDAVKTKYKELSKVYHPSSTYSNATPNPATFILLKAEYDHIIESDNIEYPIQNFILNYENIQKVVEREYNKQNVTNLSPDEIEYNRVKLYFDRLKINDDIYTIIDGILEDKDRIKFWYLSEMQKLDNLTKEHFKYITWKLKMNISIALSAYDNYIKQKVS